MVDEVEVAELSLGAPEPPVQGRRPAWLLTVLTLALALLIGMVIVSAQSGSGGSPDLIGLQAAPSASWSLPLRDGESAVAAGPALVVVQSRRLEGGRARIRGFAADSGRLLWSVAVDGGSGQVDVYDLPGTAWLAVRTGTSVALLERSSGAQRFRLQLPSRQAWFGSSDRGTLLLAVPDGDRLTISRLRGVDPADVVWSSEVPLTPGMTLGMRSTEVVERSGLLLARTRDGWRGSQRYWLALDAWTGQRPEWSLASDRFVVAGGVAVYSSDSVVAGHDLESGRQLWKLSPAAAGLLAADDVLLAESMGELRRLDPYSGRTQWSTPGREAFTDLIVDRGRVIRYAGAQTRFPEFGTTKADSPQPWVDALDLTTGRLLWRTTTPAPVLDVLVATDLLVVRMFDAASADPSFQVAGIDPSGGAVEWRWRDRRDSWALIRLGPRLATLDPDGTLTVWG